MLVLPQGLGKTALQVGSCIAAGYPIDVREIADSGPVQEQRRLAHPSPSIHNDELRSGVLQQAIQIGYFFFPIHEARHTPSFINGCV